MSSTLHKHHKSPPKPNKFIHLISILTVLCFLNPRPLPFLSRSVSQTGKKKFNKCDLWFVGWFYTFVCRSCLFCWLFVFFMIYFVQIQLRLFKRGPKKLYCRSRFLSLLNLFISILSHSQVIVLFFFNFIKIEFLNYYSLFLFFFLTFHYSISLYQFI